MDQARPVPSPRMTLFIPPNPSPNVPRHVPMFGRAAKRQRHNEEAKERSEAPRCLVVHAVSCSRETVGHINHLDTSLFLDQPRLFAGDTKASPLRGINRIPVDLDSYLDANPDVKLVVTRTYDCTEYVKGLSNDFETFQMPSTIEHMAWDLRPYFSQLQGSDAVPAVPLQESMRLMPRVRDAMHKLAVANPQSFLNWENNLAPPYSQIYHTRARMRTLADEMLDKWSGAYVLLLLEYVEGAYAQVYQDANALFAQGLVTLDHLSKLFGPSEVIVTMEDGPIKLQCYTWTFDGLFHKTQKTIVVTWPASKDAVIPITQLAAYPLRFDSTGKIEKELRDRGKMFWSCRKENYVTSRVPTSSFEIRVMNPRYKIDTITYHDLHGKEGDTAPGSSGDLDDALMESEDPPEDPFVLLLPPKIQGFGMHDKKWRTLLVKNLAPVKWNKSAFRQLVLDPQKKELVEAMVRIHTSSTMSTDVIEGKGNGLIILLHGGPGTGKTLTAESVAELAERPLYRVTCGDIGTDAESVERYLESVLYIATTWKVVLLLDESDVFLEEREKTDLQRNALVSVFLRVLEYYEGILILTSNRVGIFDEAFKSRVQLALHYPPLDYKGRWEIWNRFISVLSKQQQSDNQTEDQSTTLLAEGESIDAEELLDKIDVLAKEELNGRQIRNAITAARQLARFRGKPLGYAHLSQTISVANDFERYVEKTHGHTAGEYAKAAGMRLE